MQRPRRASDRRKEGGKREEKSLERTRRSKARSQDFVNIMRPVRAEDISSTNDLAKSANGGTVMLPVRMSIEPQDSPPGHAPCTPQAETPAAPKGDGIG